MRRKRPGAPAASAVFATVIGATFITFSSSSVTAEQPPAKDCRAVSKIEYNAAKKQYLLGNRFATYVRTGPWWRRRYWYCHMHLSAR
jgi:hypothetical protein